MESGVEVIVGTSINHVTLIVRVEVMNGGMRRVLLKEVSGTWAESYNG